MGKQVGTNVIVPGSGAGPFPVFYLLHGLSDDYTIWQRNTAIERYSAAYPMIVVMPDGYRGFYTDNDAGPAYAKYIGEELPEVIERTFHARTDRAGRCIGGLSMGGYGALRVGLGYPERYASINSHSGALDVRRYSQVNGPLPGPAATQVFGADPTGTPHDLVFLAQRAKAAGQLPKIRIDCGTEDFLLEANRYYHGELNRLNIPHEYEEFPGSHEWGYWDLHVREALAFHARTVAPAAR